MKSPEELRRENEALGDRISKLSAAILRISASLDVHTVLHEVVDSARALTGARYGVITSSDEAGQPQNFVSSGLTPDQHQQMADWADGWRLFEHLRDLPGALRLGDLWAEMKLVAQHCSFRQRTSPRLSTRQTIAVRFQVLRPGCHSPIGPAASDRRNGF